MTFDSDLEYFDYLFPSALQFGMSYRQFWYGDAETYWAYRTAFLRNLEMKRELDNFNAWLLGAYIHDSTSKVIYNAFGRENSSSEMLQYMDKPFDFDKQRREQDLIDKKNKKQEALESSMKAYLMKKKHILDKKNSTKGG